MREEAEAMGISPSRAEGEGGRRRGWRQSARWRHSANAQVQGEPRPQGEQQAGEQGSRCKSAARGLCCNPVESSHRAPPKGLPCALFHLLFSLDYTAVDKKSTSTDGPLRIPGVGLIYDLF